MGSVPCDVQGRDILAHKFARDTLPPCNQSRQDHACRYEEDRRAEEGGDDDEEQGRGRGQGRERFVIQVANV